MFEGPCGAFLSNSGPRAPRKWAQFVRRRSEGPAFGRAAQKGKLLLHLRLQRIDLCFMFNTCYYSGSKLMVKGKLAGRYTSGDGFCCTLLAHAIRIMFSIWRQFPTFRLQPPAGRIRSGMAEQPVQDLHDWQMLLDR